MKILNYGSLNIDYVYSVDHFVRPGETEAADTLSVFCGGKGLNQSIATCRAGGEVYHAGQVGQKDGHILIRALEESGVNTRFVKRLADVSSGHAIIQVDKNGQNCIMLYGGANRLVNDKDITAVLSEFSAGDYLILQNEISGLSSIIRIAHARGMEIIFNPSPIDDTILKLPLEYIDCFVINEIEAEALSKAVNSYDQIKNLNAKYPNSDILLTLGKDGAMYFDHVDKTIRSQEAIKVEAVDTTSAGDTFLGYFVAQRARGINIEENLLNAAKAASICVTRMGASPSIPYFNELRNAE